MRHKQELTREQERVKRVEKLLKEEHERGNSLLTRVKDLELQNSGLRYVMQLYGVFFVVFIDSYYGQHRDTIIALIEIIK